MANITRKIEFDMGHRVPNHEFKCYNVHGHRYVAEITVESMELNTIDGHSGEGMVIDFSILKRIAQGFIDSCMDHGYMGHEDHDKDLLELLRDKGMKAMAVDFIPTAENISVFLHQVLDQEFEEASVIEKWPYKIKVKNIRLYETPNSFTDSESMVDKAPQLIATTFNEAK